MRKHVNIPVKFNGLKDPVKKSDNFHFFRKNLLTNSTSSSIISNVVARHSDGPVVQLVRTLACHARGRRFEPVPGRHLLL